MAAPLPRRNTPRPTSRLTPSLARAAYSLAFYLALPLIGLRLLWRGRRQPAYRQHLGERFAFGLPRSARPTVWLHAVSVGEMRAAQPLVTALRERFPGHRLLLTCMTPTGRETAQQLYGAVADIAYLPYDLPDATRRFFARVRPALGVVMETEVWPNLLAAAQRAGVPLALVNARLSEKSAAGYQRVRPLAAPALARFTAVAAQTAADASRLQALGAPSPAVCGNLKFEVEPAADQLALGRAWRQAFAGRPVWLAASSREGEEGLILEALAELRQQPALANLLLVLVPRHPQRFAEVAALASSRGFAVARRSEQLPAGDTAVWLGDSMGEMAAYYACADLAVIGGSLQPFGSQNLIEACAVGAPVLLGPSVFNFAQAAELALECGAARQEADADALARAALQLLNDEDARSAMGQAGREFAAAHRGATQRLLDYLVRNVPS